MSVERDDPTEEVILTSPKAAPQMDPCLVIRVNERTVVYRTKAGTIVKRFNPGSARGAELFRMEVSNLARLWSEGVRCVPQLLDCGDMWFEMSYLDGGGIAGLPVEMGIAILIDIGRIILPEFQRHDYLYLDMKPSQIQLQHWNPCIVDHEHACFAGGVFRYYSGLGLGMNETFGTPTYMAPEVISNDRANVGHSTVTYSWAGTLVKIASERTLFDYQSMATTLRAHINEKPVRPHAISEAFWRRVLVPALRKDPRIRPTPDQLARLLRGFTASDVLGD